MPLAELCIRPRKAVWALYIDVVCINYDGNAFDAAVLAVMAALQSSTLSLFSLVIPVRGKAEHLATLPGVRYDDESGRAACEGTDRYPLPLGRIPLSYSFGTFQSCVPSASARSGIPRSTVS